MSYNYTDKINNSSQLFFFLKERLTKMYRYIDKLLEKNEERTFVKA